MTSQDVFNLIEKIAFTSSKIEKVALVKAGMVDEDFARALTLAYNPFVTFGMDNVPESTEPPVSGAGVNFDKDTWAVLQALASRSLTGGSARAAVQVEMDRLTSASGELLTRIIKKDLKAGFGESTINKAAPGSIPEFPYMRCSLPAKSNMPKWDWSVGIISQEKADGMFANVNYDAEHYLWVTSRQGNPMPLDKVPAFAAALKATFTRMTQTHGEMLVVQDGAVLPREKGNGVLNSIFSGGELEVGQSIIFHAWDQIPLTEVKPKGKYKVSYKDRLVGLIKQVKAAQGNYDPLSTITVILTKVVKSKADAYAHYRELLKEGKEGTVCKHPDAEWADNTSKDQVKLKLDADCELKVVGFFPGEGKNAATFGSLMCESACGQLKVNVSGMSDATRQALFDARDPIGIITVKSNSIMSPSKAGDPHSLFLPRFVEVRKDKSDADTLERIREQFEAAVNAA